MPVWVLVLLVAFAAVTFASHFLFPSVRWFFRRRMERLVAQLNKRLTRPIEPFKLARRYDMIQRLIYDPEISTAIAAHAAARGVPENVAFETARRYAREIVPSFSAWTYFRFATRAARLLSQAVYHVRVVHHEGDALEGVDPEATVVFVMNHRSNMDYVLVTYLSAGRGALSYAVGEWAHIWPLSALVRSMGAYFIRRRDGNGLYRVILAKYVRLATQGGVSQAVFPEGGLSLTGRMAEPRLGILKYIVEAHDPAGRDVVFVPVALNYDRVLEDRILVRADAGGTRRFKASVRSALWFGVKTLWSRVTGRYVAFGYAGVSFGAPLSLSGFEGGVEALAQDLMGRIAKEVPVLPVPLVATALLQGEGPVDRVALEMRVKALLAQLAGASVYVPRENRGYAVEVGLRTLQARKLVVETDGQVQIVEAERPLLTFYAASIAHLLPNGSGA
ncbi:glycerol-3-phosphate acyltransferase [Thalassovita taeanensis]|uniref:Glycerol-3-phosphate acyltransferase n=2 Tax=Thalassovita taeanensis TaxID=657014 RepID=A0A1H9D974_9RHOB|nr:glycerol-3-phosphate acyltransferase [Thalassovita taeanensis]